MANLPHELINEILLWLPVKSLLRFRCVSKSVCDSIGSQSFINSQFKRSTENRIHRKLIDLGELEVDNAHRIHALAFNDDFQQELALDKLFLSSLDLVFFSYCNGLVLLFIDQLSLWNPSTREYRILPDLPVEHNRKLNFALGYDSTTDDYKAVVITVEKRRRYSQVWIFELRSNHWRRIQDFPYVECYSMENGGNGDCFVDGAMHFLCHGTNAIIAFDVSKETFSVLQKPVHPTNVIPTSLNVFEGCLSISMCSMIPTSRISLNTEQVDIYVRKKDGVAFTWTRLYSVTETQVFSEEAIECFASGRVAYSKEGDKVFLSSNGKLCSYDIEEKTLQEIVSRHTDHLDIFSCTESLASVDP